MTEAAPKELSDLLENYPTPVRQLALALRERIRKVVPDARERVDPKTRVVGYGFGSGYRDLVCTMILSKKGVKLGLVGAATLPDPFAMLEGEGKRHRHIPLQHESDLNRPGLDALLQAGVASWRSRSR